MPETKKTSSSIGRKMFNVFSISLFSLLGVLVGLLSYQAFSGQRLAFHANKVEAYYLYSVIAPWYDNVLNPWHWTPIMRDRALGQTPESQAKQPLWARWTKDAPIDIVDVGAGTGFTTIGAVRASHPDSRVTMLDQSDHQFIEARKKPELQKATLVIGDAHALPFPDSSFDRWTSAGSIEYWPEPQQAINEAFRVLRPGGVACIIGPARPTHTWAKMIADFWYLFPDGDEYKTWFENAGFEDVTVIPLDPEWYGPTDRQFGLIMGFTVVGRRGTKKPVTSVKHVDAAVADTPFALIVSRFVIGNVGAIYYTFLPMYVAFKRERLFGFPPLNDSADYLLGLLLGQVIWMFVAAHLQKPAAVILAGIATKTTGGTSIPDSITLRSFVELSRPHTITGTVSAVVVGYLLAATFVLDYTSHWFKGLLILVSGLAVNIFIVALNQICDVEIDVENDKQLPIATGEMSWNTARLITHVSLLVASAVSLGGVGATWYVVVMFLAVLGTLYSVEPFRFKRFSTTS